MLICSLIRAFPASWVPAATMLLVLTLAAPAAAGSHQEMLARSRATVADLQGYRMVADLTLIDAQGARADTSLIQLRTAARWPDRLVVTQVGQGGEAHLGTGPEGAWFHISQLEGCYVGGPAPLDRDFDTAGSTDFMATGGFSFLAGLTPVILPAEGNFVAAGDSVLQVGGKRITCRVLRVPPPPPTGDPASPRPGIRTYCVDPHSGFVFGSRVEMKVQQGGQDLTRIAVLAVAELEFTAPQDNIFKYSPPAGVRVVDHPDRLTNPEALTGRPAPDVAFRDLDGREFRLSDYRGKVLFLDVWATWCPPCRREMPHIETLYKELAGDGVAFLAVSSEAPATIRQFLTGKPYTFPIATVSERDAALALKATSIPTGLVIDGEGIVRAHMVGGQTEAQLRAALARAGVGH